MLLEVKNGCFSFGKQEILKDINISVSNNDVFAVLGRNGAGKTTLLRCIMNMLSFKSGCALLGGTDIRDIPQKKLWQKIAYVPQAKRGSDMSVRDMIVMGRSPHLGAFGSPKEEDYAIADDIIDKMYINKIRDKSCDCISGGELQMVLIARAVAAQPKIMIMDEPESNLDYHNQMHILKLIADLSSGLGEAMVGINPNEIKLIMEERGK